MTGPSGRSCERGSPSKLTMPRDKAASGGRNLITVPAFPTSIEAGPKSGAGVMLQISSPLSSTPSEIPIPRARRPWAISSVSRERSGRRRIEGVLAIALRTSARFVTDFEPGIVMVAATGVLPRKGARHIWVILVHSRAREMSNRLGVCAVDLRSQRC